MKIIFDARVLNHKIYTGVENYTKYILENISKELEIDVVKPNVFNKYLAHLWLHFILPLKRGDILFSPANIAPIFLSKKKKLVITIHDVAFLTFQSSFSKLFEKYYKFIIPKNIKRADKIITVSNFSKNEIEKHYPDAKGKIEVIYLGVDKIFRPMENIKKKNQILYVGSLNERKNFKGVIEAFFKLNRKDLKLVMVGNFSDTFKLSKESLLLLKKVKNNKNILFLSNVSKNDLVNLYNESKLFIYPSFYEGFGLPILEAMACGTPVITSNIASLPEVGGDAVIYCNPFDINDIKEKINIVLNDENLQQDMIRKGIKRAKHFTWESAAKKHLKVFLEILKI